MTGERLNGGNEEIIEKQKWGWGEGTTVLLKILLRSTWEWGRMLKLQEDCSTRPAPEFLTM